MKDPTRIPHMIDALRRAWEGQPDITLPELLGVVANRGIGWASTDDDLLQVLNDIESEHPSLIDASTIAHLTITTSSPAHVVTLGGGTVVVRSARDAGRMPGVWSYSSMRRTGPGLPLVIADTEGVEHRLGVVGLVSVFDPEDAPDLLGLDRLDVGNHRWLVAFEDGRRAVIGQRIRVWEQVAREVSSSMVAWERIDACAPGEDLVVKPAGGGRASPLGRVASVHVLEV
ncbi:hypothetical protein G7Y29_01535 [Corynebacterium qintianiae]|uniref:Uncharacterized protein n=1 Tax=Corynebacterium qintianiae TaxID=2709392 RepID=A0A7T0PER2_9CORY|nr:hypothetical protein [Corynebacterium qintianiae]QPK83521.1 hypothetical protein G7Y29_01535 [Corynebacterium qintianiae]